MPVWNKEFEFEITYPPMVKCLKIELIKKNLFTEIVIATEYIYIDEISNPYTESNYLPAFGPSYIYLYNEPYVITRQKLFKRNYPKKKKHKHTKKMDCKFCERIESNTELNENLDTQCFYKKNRLKLVSLLNFNGACNKFVGRLKIQIESDMVFNDSKHNSCAPRDFILFASINEVNLFNSKYKKSKISLRLNIGPYGYNQSCSTNKSEELYPNSLNENSIYLPFESNKPNIYLNFSIDDTFEIVRMKKNNFLRTKIKEMVY